MAVTWRASTKQLCSIYKLAFCPPTVPTPSRCTIRSLVKKSDGHCALTCASMYSDAILTCAAWMPGRLDTLADSSEKMGSRYDAVMLLPVSCASVLLELDHRKSNVEETKAG